MATKEDILEQVVEEYLIHRGYFVQHNVKFRPRKDHPDFVTKQDSNHSDIDVLGYHPLLTGPRKVLAISCKSWQSGFHAASEMAAIQGNKTIRGRKAWQGFRELCSPKWTEAFVTAVENVTGCRDFTHVLAVSHLHGDRSVWESSDTVFDASGLKHRQIITFGEMVADIEAGLSTTVAATEVGRRLGLRCPIGIAKVSIFHLG